ncbi:hypothetical protein [Caminibacter sp.]
MKDKIGLIIGLVIGLYGLFRIDYELYLGLNYFGKYVFFALFNIFIIYFYWFLYKKSKGAWKNIFPLIYGIFLLIVGLSV